MTRLPAAVLVVLLAVPASAWAQDAARPSGEPASPPAASVAPSAEPQAASPEATPLSEAEESELGPRISAVRVEGNRRVEGDAVRNAIKSKPGTAFDINVLRADLQSLWQLGFFSDVEILVDEVGERGPVLIIRVKEKPAIREVKVRGNDALSNDDLKNLVDIKPSSILDMAAVRRNAVKLQDKYVEKGFYLAEVTPKVEPRDNNEVAVFFDVNEHAKVQVKRITFVGNQMVPDEDLKKVMQTQEAGFLSFLTSSGTYREEVFQNDLAGIQSVYYDRGFVHVRVGQPQIALSPDKRLIFISIPITEGEQFRIGAVDISGDMLLPREELHKKVEVEPGELFNRSKLQRDIMALTEVYYDAGYAYANITPQTTVDPDQRTVDLTFDIQQGEKITIERIEISGNHKTRDKVIRRELRVYEGELFNGTGLRMSRQRVTALGFFETVDINFKRGSAENTVVVNVVVKEKPTGTFQVGLGFSSIESFLLTAQISQNNVFGWGQNASLAAQISSLRSLIQLSYVDPYFLDSQWILSFDYFRQELDYDGFIRSSNGGNLTLGYHLTENLMLHAGYAIENVRVDPGTGSDTLLFGRFENGLTSALRLTLNYDRRDNRLFPTSGHYESISVEHSPSWLGATNLFTRYTANARVYRPLLAGFVLKAQGTLGYIRGSGEPIPISELYFIGGINTVRGYNLRTISPAQRIGTGREFDSTLSKFFVGGDKQLIFNFEVEFPIFEKVGIRGVVFYDAGNVYAENEALFDSQDKLPLGLFHSVGFGFRWFSPIGPLRFEWGIPLTRRKDVDTQAVVFEFTIGNFF